MSFESTMRNKRTWIIGVPVLLVVIFVGWSVRLHQLHQGRRAATAEAGQLGGQEHEHLLVDQRRRAASIDGDVDGEVRQHVGYRVPEVLFGQSTEAAGRTTRVTGTMTIDGTTVEDATFTADLTG